MTNGADDVKDDACSFANVCVCTSRKDPVQEEPYQRCGHEETGTNQRVLQGEPTE